MIIIKPQTAEKKILKNCEKKNFLLEVFKGPVIFCYNYAVSDVVILKYLLNKGCFPSVNFKMSQNNSLDIHLEYATMYKTVHPA